MTRLTRTLFAAMLLGATLCLTAAAQAPAAGTSEQPMTNGAPGQKMDAGEADAQMESYRHSSTVQAIAHVLHISVERAAQIFEDFNSGLLILVVGYFLVRFLPKAFQARRSKIDHDLADARSATEMANQRLQAVEARLASLDGEIEAIRAHAAHDSEGDQKRIAASLEEERARIIRSAEQEIGAAQAAAQRELKRFAADLAVERAMTRIELTPDDDRVLVHDFTESLGTKLHSGDYQKRGQN